MPPNTYGIPGAPVLSMYYDEIMKNVETSVTIRADAAVIEAAARALGVHDPDASLSQLTRDVIHAAAGAPRPPRMAGAGGGGQPKRAGREWENLVVGYAQEHGFQWDRAPLRGARDLLDVTGCLPAGWLVGAKSLAVGQRLDQRASEAMHQAHRAMENLEQRGLGDLPRSSTIASTGDVIPWQIFQRRGHPVGAAYAITEYDWMLRIAEIRRDQEKTK